MCYTGKCEFESFWGGCNLKISQKEFENRYSHSPCVVGDLDSDSDEIRKVKNDYEENN